MRNTDWTICCESARSRVNPTGEWSLKISCCKCWKTFGERFCEVRVAVEIVEKLWVYISLLLPRFPKVPSQCYLDEPGNLGNVGSKRNRACSEFVQVQRSKFANG